MLTPGDDTSGSVSPPRRDIPDDALLRACRDAMLDPQVILEAVWRDGRVVDLIHRDINAAGCSYFGMTREQFVGSSMFDSELFGQYARCAETGDPLILDAFPYYSEFVGALRYYDVRANRICPELLAVTWRDVTDRTEATRQIAASEERFRLLADNVADVVCLLDDDGTIRWASNSIEQALGAPPHEWVGRSILDSELTADRARIAADWSQVVEGNTFIGRLQIRGADGIQHWVHIHSKPFFDATGKRDGRVSSFRVIDEEVAAEEAVRAEITRRDQRNRQLAARLMSQLNSAASYVASILPDDLDEPVGVSARYLPAEELGGDSYDFRWIDDEHLIFYLVDVSGHGVEPALLSVSVHNILRSGTVDAETLLNPGLVLSELNRMFTMDRQGGHYFTVWYGVYHRCTRTVRFASAGHPPALLLAGGRPPVQLRTGSMPVGLLDAADFETRTHTLPPGSKLLLYSDGALELGRPEGQERTVIQLAQAFAGSCESPEGTLTALIATLQEGSSGVPVVDDVTFVCLSFH